MSAKKNDAADKASIQMAPSAPKSLSKPKVASGKAQIKKDQTKVTKAAIIEVTNVDVEKPIKKIKVSKETKPTKKAKQKVVRDSYTMPADEYSKIAELKERCLKAGVHIKKTEVLRAGLIALCAMSESQLTASLLSLDKIATGRPKH